MGRWGRGALGLVGLGLGSSVACVSQPPELPMPASTSSGTEGSSGDDSPMTDFATSDLITTGSGDTTAEADSTGGPACAPGTSMACVCPGGASGTQACNAEGTGYDACACEDGDTGVAACTDTNDCGTCQQCTQGRGCKTESDACLSFAACLELATCLSACAMDPEPDVCVQDCADGSTMEAIDVYNALTTCVLAECMPVCG